LVDAGSSSLCLHCGASLPEGARFCPACGGYQDRIEDPQAADLDPSRISPRGKGPAGPHEETPPGPLGRSPDELRPMTALFADIVGSSSLGERLAPDEVKSLVGECVSRMSQAVEEFGGTVQAYMGDGIAAYFGIPIAHEDDPERAARAALRILDLVRDYSADVREAWGIQDFDVRIGINSGKVGVGLVGASNPQSVGLGDTTNVAARLQSVGAPGTIVVGDGSARLLAHRFSMEPLGRMALKGREAPVLAWRLTGARTGEEAVGRSPMIGRDSQVDRLREVVGELKAGRGQVATVVGDAGVGKTRLIEELRALAGNAVTWLEGRCPSYGRKHFYAPFVQILSAWLGVVEGEAEIVIRTRLRARMHPLLGSRMEEILPFLGRLLSIKLDAQVEDQLHETSPPVLARHIRAAYRLWVETLAADKPLILAVDDLQWADASTREMAEDLLPLTDRAPVLLVSGFRPAPESEAWRFRLRVLADYSHRARELSLEPLPDDAVGDMIESLAPKGTISAFTRRAIIKRAEGNPLFIEELLRSLLESGALVRPRSWTLSVSHQVALPSALETLLVARIDRLPPSARRIAQVASVIGREFPLRVLERVLDVEDLEDHLALLLRSDIIREARRYPALEYSFKHGLLQEAALSTLPTGTRRELYGRVATAYEDLFQGSIEEHLERLAQYYAFSRNHLKALDYLERAGERAAAAGAIDEAAEMWRRGLKVAERSGDTAAKQRLEHRLSGIPLPVSKPD
jgi:class 3 adenylate cyclase